MGSRAKNCHPSAYLGNVDDVPLHDFEQRMLHPLARDISTDANVSPALANLVDLVDVNDAPLTAFDVLSAFEIQLIFIPEEDE